MQWRTQEFSNSCTPWCRASHEIVAGGGGGGAKKKESQRRCLNLRPSLGCMHGTVCIRSRVDDGKVFTANLMSNSLGLIKKLWLWQISTCEGKKNNRKQKGFCIALWLRRLFNLFEFDLGWVDCVSFSVWSPLVH